MAARPPITQNPDIRFLGRLLGDVIRAYDGEALFRRIMPIVEASGDHRDLGAGYRYAALLREMGRRAEADALERRTRAAQEAASSTERST